MLCNGSSYSARHPRLQVFIPGCKQILQKQDGASDRPWSTFSFDVRELIYDRISLSTLFQTKLSHLFSVTLVVEVTSVWPARLRKHQPSITAG